MAKNDEFYTLLKDIEAELKHYNFENKIVYCPCDNYEWSNFALYFSKNFKHLKLKSLICSCYYPTQTHFFENYKRGFWVEFNGKEWSNKHYFKNGNGDFRSAECAELKARADCIVTNPPFSLFTEFFFWILEKQFFFFFNYWSPSQFDVLSVQHKLVLNGKNKNIRIIIKRKNNNEP